MTMPPESALATSRAAVWRAACAVVIGIALGLSSLAAGAQTQGELSKTGCEAYKKADQQLNTVYRQVLTQQAADRAFVSNFRNAQRAWLVFRDASVAAIYPAKNKMTAYGSAYPMCRCADLALLTTQRIEQLQAWLHAEEGDVCAGSRMPWADQNPSP